MKEQEKEMKRLKRKREEKVVWKNKSCEFQYKYNDGVKDWIVEDLRRELERKFGDEIPESLEEVVKKGEKLVDDRNFLVKMADELGWSAVGEFEKDELARDEKEEKKLAKLRKEFKERESRVRFRNGRRYYRGSGVSGRRYYGGGYQRYNSFDGGFRRGDRSQEVGSGSGRARSRSRVLLRQPIEEGTQRRQSEVEEFYHHGDI